MPTNEIGCYTTNIQFYTEIQTLILIKQNAKGLTRWNMHTPVTMATLN